jgi:hypothetical protein
MQQGRGGAAIMTSLLPMALGAFLAIAGVIGGSRRDIIIGLALVATGLVGLVAPRLAPPPGLSREQLRARRTAVVILPNGIIYVALGVLLIVVLPASERDGPTLLIIIFALGMGTLSILSGLGALARARRPDGTPRRDGRAGTEKRGEA